MTPLGIKTGRMLSSVVSVVSVGAGATAALVPGAGDRVALVVALPAAVLTAFDGSIAIGYLIGGVFAALTCLTPGHPVCYLSVDKIGVALFSEISAQNACTGAVVLTVTNVRQTQELP